MFRTVSAAAILLIGIISLLFIRQMKVTDQSVTGVNAIMGETLPSEEIYLITGDKKTELAHNAHIGVTQEGKVVITDSNKQERQLSLADTELNRLVVQVALLADEPVAVQDEPLRLEVQVARLNNGLGQAPQPDQELADVLRQLLETGPIASDVWASRVTRFDALFGVIAQRAT